MSMVVWIDCALKELHLSSGVAFVVAVVAKLMILRKMSGASSLMVSSLILVELWFQAGF